ncbi:MAG: hypothetical protein R2844_06405 [Caldilineales bacterium]
MLRGRRDGMAFVACGEFKAMPVEGQIGFPKTYVAYMLRMWQAGSRDGLPVWRASLENPHTGECLAFGNAEEMFAFLVQLMADVRETRDPP